MSTKTNKLGLIKPELTDAADITAYNENWEKLDKALLTSGGTMDGELKINGIVPVEPILHDVGSPTVPFGSMHAKHYNIYSHPDKECGEMSVHITGTPEQSGEVVISAGNNIPEGNEGNSRGRVRLYGKNKGYIDLISNNESETNYEILLPNGNGTLALEGNCVKVATGTYTGDDTESKFIDIGFTPDAVIVQYNAAPFTSFNLKDGSLKKIYWGGFATKDEPYSAGFQTTSGGSNTNHNIIEIVTNGFNVFSLSSYDESSKIRTNAAAIFNYIAIKKNGVENV